MISLSELEVHEHDILIVGAGGAGLSAAIDKSKHAIIQSSVWILIMEVILITSGQITGSNIRIRPMEPEDIEAILAIDRKITGVRRAITYTDLITGDLGGVLDLSVVAEVRGKVAGFILARHACVGEPIVEVGLIQVLGVDPDYWRQSIGTKLVNTLLGHCQSKGLKTVRAMINEDDSQLQQFFERTGFHRGQLIDYVRTCEAK